MRAQYTYTDVALGCKIFIPTEGVKRFRRTNQKQIREKTSPKLISCEIQKQGQWSGNQFHIHEVLAVQTQTHILPWVLNLI